MSRLESVIIGGKFCPNLKTEKHVFEVPKAGENLQSSNFWYDFFLTCCFYEHWYEI